MCARTRTLRLEFTGVLATHQVKRSLSSWPTQSVPGPGQFPGEQSHRSHGVGPRGGQWCHPEVPQTESSLWEFGAGAGACSNCALEHFPHTQAKPFKESCLCRPPRRRAPGGLAAAWTRAPRAALRGTAAPCS